MDAIILAGGKGTRMNDVVPKALVVAHGKPILAHQLDFLLPKVGKVILALGFQSEQIIDYVKTYYRDAPVSWSVEEQPLGTGGALKQAMSQSDADKVLVLNADDILDLDLSLLERSSEHTICVCNPRLPFGLVAEQDGYAQFVEKPLMTEHWVSCGWYLFLRDQLMEFLPDNGMLEYDVFPQIKLKVHRHTGFWQPLNSKKDIMTFEERELPIAFI